MDVNTKRKVKVLVATNIYKIDPVVYAGHLDAFYKLGKAFDEIEAIFFGPWRLPIDAARNNAAQMALRWECDYLLFYDDDMYFEKGGDLVKLIRAINESNGEINAIQALAYIRGYPFKPMAFKYVEVEGEKRLQTYDKYMDDVDEKGLVKCDALGCCATIIDCKLFKMVPQPWFVTGHNHTEDIYFFVKAAQFVNNVNIYMDTTIKIGHLLNPPILTESNKEVLKKMHEDNGINQLFLPDPHYVPMIQASKMMAYEERTSINPLEHLDVLKLKEDKNGR